MFWPFHDKKETNYWLKVFALYALVEALIQLLFFVILNNFGTQRISILEYHLVMLLFQCILIIPIWWVAWSVSKKKLIVQILVNIVFYVVYSYVWFGPVQDAIAYLYNNLQEITRPVTDRQVPYLDRGNEYSFLNYQLLKHAFRLSWFYLAAYFYNYRLEEKKRTELAVANKELQLKMLKWHLNPTFYFKTINHLRDVADIKPVNATGPILQLAKVMEYVIYEAKEKLIDVKKEIHFLNNYTQLINQQGNNLTFETEVSGDQENLKISPLLLAGFIDKLAEENVEKENRLYKLRLQFSGKEMTLDITGNLPAGPAYRTGRQTGPEQKSLATSMQDETLLRRLEDLYPGRFSVNSTAKNNFFKLTIMLDEER